MPDKSSTNETVRSSFDTKDWKDVDELKEQWSLDNIFSAEMHEEMAEVLLAEWHKAVGRSLNWAAD